MSGLWLNLGTILPLTDRWEKFPIPSSVSANFIKVTFLYAGNENSNNVRSYFLLRRIWTNENPSLVERAIKVWPDNNPILIINPEYQNYINAGLTNYFYQGKIGFYWKNKGIIENAYQVRLEEL